MVVHAGFETEAELLQKASLFETEVKDYLKKFAAGLAAATHKNIEHALTKEVVYEFIRQKVWHDFVVKEKKGILRRNPVLVHISFIFHNNPGKHNFRIEVKDKSITDYVRGKAMGIKRRIFDAAREVYKVPDTDISDDSGKLTRLVAV